jgi:hypothetical protein
MIRIEGRYEYNYLLCSERLNIEGNSTKIKKIMFYEKKNKKYAYIVGTIHAYSSKGVVKIYAEF